MSTFANRFDVTHYGDLVRIVFYDCIQGNEGVVVGNVVMRASDGITLSRLLVEMAEKQAKGKS